MNGETPVSERRIDPVTLSTVWHSFQSTAREMRHVVDRTAQSYLLAQLHDMAAGIWDAKSRTIAVPEGPTSMFLSQKFAIETILEKFEGNLHPGDVILTNDPFKGHCNHLPDWGFIRPIFFEGELLFMALTRGHQMDTGGSFPGGYFPNGFDIHAEGLMIPPIKIYDRGVERTDVLELVWNNVRFPEGVRIDNAALIAGLTICDNRITALLEKYGRDTVLDCVDEMLERTERVVRRQIAAIPDGVYHGESATDDDGTVLDEQVWVRCEATVKGDELTLDFSASDDQRRGFVNCVYASTYSRAVAGSFLFLDPALTEFHNEGSMACMDVIAPEGNVCNAQYPATVGGSPVNVGTQVLEATVEALSQAMPDRAIAAWGRRRGHYISGSDPRTGERYVQTTTDADGGGGAVAGFDGFEGACGMSGLGSIQRGSMEEVEIRFPWRHVRYQFAPDMLGAGKWRGGSGMLWEVENVGSRATLATGSSDGDTTHAPGAIGGDPSPLSTMYKLVDGKKIPLQTHRMHEVQPGEILGKVSGGGGGVGDPREREVEKVLDDVVNEFITIDAARESYGVAIDAATMTVDADETAKLRGVAA
ncbi:Hydantoinase B/oxoprolinase [Conexibacter woesei DSM 14684]|uniref:Hydantoinase B/oxoprolinase n=1 Tax=Conexibacter woesei (strain DSM 14684 / CCUG 47730 / CIP 108061 / JCM 11494 / NBRC 100937 / ID131577) TaxID=469383 RepID=D3F4P2_CONWI|nr:Hydantoinase B/oxoprolinase [Conexibacter woesei DSM 14684]